VRCARQRGITVIRTPLICAEAKVLGLIDNVREKLEQLRTLGFRLSDAHHERILKELGEL
jgi:predicted nucleic acid-binding protein